jgi:hypothetical protein
MMGRTPDETDTFAGRYSFSLCPRLASMMVPSQSHRDRGGHVPGGVFTRHVRLQAHG